MAFLGDQAPGERLVIIAGQPMTGNKGSACIAAIGLDSPYDLKGPWIRQSTTGISSVVVLPGHQQFATGGSSCYLTCDAISCDASSWEDDSSMQFATR